MSNKILLVDDEEIIRELFKEYLTEEGFEVKAASSGKEAIEIVKGETFDLFLVDLIMPEMDGLQLLQEFRRFMIDVPVILLTAYGVDLDKSRKESLNIRGFIPKGIPMAEVSEKIKKLLKGEENGEKGKDTRS